ncbi:hypothetical protein EQW78_00610 [Oerskovia turbata]|uniref:Uncharacterized protein n=1 Tax=Oerskovia turbata TaxID=1713 RepID=A0A4Q1L498_9CELL|nr:hypothetical protein [Oerskovia turbata]RXR26191.1 hypothetical protein EQW73_07555 [Oerskovia turbata]RXR36693.1 hypothetical protein EQW78_00610 [Oerskovia turbata]TGJ97382.1 hypothetical protein DLJ96_05250 [Actinotalea fermentans ATCC 43279 = JCM 9966 = DSM 3133]
MPATVPALAAADSARLRTRAARHARSLPLAVCGLTVVLLAGTGRLAGDQFWLIVLLPLGAFLLTYVAAFALRLPTGVGVGSDGYGIALVLSALIAFLFPWILFATGVPFALGLGLVVLGLRASDRLLWVAGLVAMTASLALVTTGGPGGASPVLYLAGTITLGLALLAAALVALRGERETLAADDGAPSIGDPATDNLRVLAVLGDADEADQPALARLTGIEERNLAARLHDLTEASLVQARITKNRNWAQITREGREELRTRREALRGVAEHRKA